MYNHSLKESFSNFFLSEHFLLQSRDTPIPVTEAKGDIWAHVMEKSTGRSTWISSQVIGRV